MHARMHTVTVVRWIESAYLQSVVSNKEFNTMVINFVKRLQNWREVTVDAIVLLLHHLHVQAFYHNEIQWDYYVLGTYTLS